MSQETVNVNMLQEDAMEFQRFLEKKQKRDKKRLERPCSSSANSGSSSSSSSSSSDISEISEKLVGDESYSQTNLRGIPLVTQLLASQKARKPKIRKKVRNEMKGHLLHKKREFSGGNNSNNCDDPDDSNSEQDNSDISVDEVMRHGKRCDRVPLDLHDQKLAEELGPKFDLLYEKIPSQELKEIKARATAFTTMFDDYPLLPVKRGSTLDREGKKLQEDAIIIAKEANIARKLLHGNEDKVYIDAYLEDIIKMASLIGTEGSLKRLYVRQPKLARVLTWSSTIPAYTEKMKEEYKEVKENFKGTSVFYSLNNGFGRFRAYSSMYNRQRQGIGGRGYSGYSGIWNKNSDYVQGQQFFLEGGEVTRPTLSPRVLTGRLSKTQIKTERTEAETGETTIINSDTAGDPAELLSEGGSFKEVYMEVEAYWWILFCEVWCYVEFHGSSKSNGIFPDTQEVLRIQREIKENAEALRRTIRGDGEEWDSKRDPLREAGLHKSYKSSSKGKWKDEAGSGYASCESLDDTKTFQDGGGSNTQTASRERRLCSVIRSQRCLHPRPGPSLITESVRCLLAGKNISFCGNAIRPQRRTAGVFSNYEKSGESNKRVLEYKMCSLSRRSHSSSPRPSPPRKCREGDHRFSNLVGMDRKPREKSVETKQTVEILGMAMGYGSNGNLPTGGPPKEGTTIIKVCKKEGIQTKVHDRSVVSEVCWCIKRKPCSISPSKSLSDEVASLSIDNSQQKGMELISENELLSNRGVEEVVTMVKGKSPTEFGESSITSSLDNNGCGPIRVGCNIEPFIINQHTTEEPPLSSGNYGIRVVESPYVLPNQQQTGVDGCSRGGGPIPSYPAVPPVLLNPHSIRQFNNCVQHQSESGIQEPLSNTPEVIVECVKSQPKSFSQSHTRRRKLSDRSTKQIRNKRGLPGETLTLVESPKSTRISYRYRSVLIKEESSDSEVLFIKKPEKSILGSTCRNALYVSWIGMNPLIHPPIPLIYRALQKFSREGKMGVLITPDWKGQIWSPLLRKMSIRKIVLGPSRNVLRKGPLMKKRNLCLPPGNIAIHLLSTENLRQRD
jgi:hypothetical protein